MKNSTRERDRCLRGKLMSANDHVRNWHILKTKLSGEADPVEEFPKEKPEIEKISRLESPRKKKYADRSKGIKFQKKNSGFFDTKPKKKAKTAREPLEVKPEVKRFRKPSDKVKGKESVVFFWQKKEEPRAKRFPSFSTWDHTNYSTVNRSNIKISDRNALVKEPKFRKAEKFRKLRSKSTCRIEKNECKPIKNRSRDTSPVSKKREYERELDRSENYFAKDRQKQKNDYDRQAIVIYQRQNKKNFMGSEYESDYRFERISFTGSCEATVDFAHSKRSTSEPRRQSLNEFGGTTTTTNRKTRTQKPSDFYSTLDFFPSDDVSENKKTQETQPGSDKQKEEKVNDQASETTPKSVTECKYSSNKEMVKKRLEEAAEKKLNLHREMIRLERIDRMKFWESIKQSLNYRCALAEMFSSQSYLSHNGSAKYYSATENSTEIFVRGNVIEKISSYQEFHRVGNAIIENNHRPSKGLRPHSASGYVRMKNRFDTVFIKEEEENRPKGKRIYYDVSSSRSSFSSTSQESIRQETDSSQQLLVTKSKKLAFVENNLEFAPSELQMMMMKLTNEIKKCSEFLNQLHSDKKQLVNNHKLTLKSSVSESELFWEKKSFKDSYNGAECVMLPVMLYPAIGSHSNLNSKSDTNETKKERQLRKKKEREEQRQKKIDRDKKRKASSKSIDKVNDKTEPEPENQPPPPISRENVASKEGTSKVDLGMSKEAFSPENTPNEQKEPAASKAEFTPVVEPIPANESPAAREAAAREAAAREAAAKEAAAKESASAKEFAAYKEVPKEPSVMKEPSAAQENIETKESASRRDNVREDPPDSPFRRGLPRDSRELRDKKVKKEQSFKEDRDSEVTVINKEDLTASKISKSNVSLKSYSPEPSEVRRPQVKLIKPTETVAKAPKKKKSEKPEKSMDDCCEDCQLLMKRIMQLEKELERIEKKIPLNTLQHKISVKECLERLSKTSETMLARLRSWSRYNNDFYCDRKVEKYRRSSSAPEPPVKKEMRRRLTLKPSGSDYNLNVGMEITMENVDPKTGKKLFPEVNRSTEQSGNIQCRVFKNNEPPVMIMDTDFCYNPETGMLFNRRPNRINPHKINIDPPPKKKSPTRQSQNLHRTDSEESLLDVQHMYRQCLRSNPFRPKIPDSDRVLKYKDVSCMVIPCLSTDVNANKGSQYGEAVRKKDERYICVKEKSLLMDRGVGGEEWFVDKGVGGDIDFDSIKRHEKSSSMRGFNKYDDDVCEVKIVDEPKLNYGDNKDIRTKRSKSKARFQKSKEGKPEKLTSRIPRRRKETPNISDSIEKSPSSTKSSCTSVKSEKSEPEPSREKTSKKHSKKAHAKKSKSKIRVEMVDKCTQTVEKRKVCKPKIQKVDCETQTHLSALCQKHTCSQACAEMCSEGMQTCQSVVAVHFSETHTQSSRSVTEVTQESQTDFPVPVRTLANVAIQTHLETKSHFNSNVGLQTNLPTKESLKYINDLEIQKKVNMAIAELCFHLTKAKGKESV